MVSLSLPEASKLNLPIASLEDLCRRHAEYKVAEKHNDDDTQNAFIKYVLLYAMLACSVVCGAQHSGRADPVPPRFSESARLHTPRIHTSRYCHICCKEVFCAV